MKNLILKFWPEPLQMLPFILTVILLAVTEWNVKMPMLLVNRFFPGYGWIEIILLAVYASFLFAKLKDAKQSVRWRKISWTVFSIIFFGQLLFGLLGCQKCLMTGELHFPIPALILGGSLYRMELSFMPILFISTVILSGPAWCSQLCYFGAFDNLAAYSGKPGKLKIHNKNLLKNTFLILMVSSIILLRLFNAPVIYAVIGASVIGITGVLIIIFYSPKKGKMMHCIAYCPIGTLMQFMKLISPFRMRIKTECTSCMLCVPKCPYDALSKEDIAKRRPGPTCTYCGDCLSACHGSFIEYWFPGLKAIHARNLFLVITVSLHAVFIGLARI